MPAATRPMDPGLVLLSAAELTTVGVAPAVSKPSSKADIELARRQAIARGARATRRHNLAIACSLAGSQAALAARLAELTGTTARAKRAAIARVLADERALTEECACLVERVMGWDYYRMTTEWIERRRNPAPVLPGHVLERRHWQL